ncbi:MAG: ComF family protein [Desulfuromonadales bacterium]
MSSTPIWVFNTLTVKLFLQAALDVLFPPLCHICRSFIPNTGELHICSECRERLPLVSSPFCTICGIPFIGAGDNHPCGQCQTHPPHFDAARAHLLYDGSARDLIHYFKYRYKIHLRRPLVLLTLEGLTEFITSRAPDVIIPVPLHRSRLQSRGFNQSVLLGNLFSSRLSIPMVVDGLARIRQTESQADLSAEARRNNVKGAFAAQRPGDISGKRILLLDDVMTTGSTVNECARVLKKASAASVVVAAIARAVK